MDRRELLRGLELDLADLSTVFGGADDADVFDESRLLGGSLSESDGGHDQRSEAPETEPDDGGTGAEAPGEPPVSLGRDPDAPERQRLLFSMPPDFRPADSQHLTDAALRHFEQHPEYREPLLVEARDGSRFYGGLMTREGFESGALRDLERARELGDGTDEAEAMHARIVRMNEDSRNFVEPGAPADQADRRQMSEESGSRRLFVEPGAPADQADRRQLSEESGSRRLLVEPGAPADQADRRLLSEESRNLVEPGAPADQADRRQMSEEGRNFAEPGAPVDPGERSQMTGESRLLVEPGAPADQADRRLAAEDRATFLKQWAQLSR